MNHTGKSRHGPDTGVGKGGVRTLYLCIATTKIGTVGIEQRKVELQIPRLLHFKAMPNAGSVGRSRRISKNKAAVQSNSKCTRLNRVIPTRQVGTYAEHR